MNALTIHDSHFGGVVTRRSASAWVPDLVAAAGPRATDAYIEFFTATIRDRNTRLAYARSNRRSGNAAMMGYGAP
jgi:hypothetical protein